MVWRKGDVRGKDNGRTAYMFDQGSLVLESVTLAQLVELVVKVLIDLASGAVPDQKSAEDPEAAHP
jgi:hypothetical protein